MTEIQELMGEGISMFPDYTSTGLWNAKTGVSLSVRVVPEQFRQQVRDWHATWAKWDIDFRYLKPEQPQVSEAWLKEVDYEGWYRRGAELAKAIQDTTGIPVLYRADTYDEVLNAEYGDNEHIVITLPITKDLLNRHVAVLPDTLDLD